MGVLRKVTLDRANIKKDKSATLTFITELEETPQTFVEIHQQLNQHGVLYFKSSGSLTQKELDEIDNVDVVNEGKSKSQKQRNALYRVWEKLNPPATFDEWYSVEMDRIRQHYLDKLD